VREYWKENAASSYLFGQYTFYYEDDQSLEMPVYGAKQTAVLIYPNPATDMLSIRLAEAPARLKALHIYNAIGQQVVHAVIQQTLSTINVEVLSPVQYSI
jgi:hypothetical protein